MNVGQFVHLSQSSSGMVGVPDTSCTCGCDCDPGEGCDPRSHTCRAIPQGSVGDTSGSDTSDNSTLWKVIAVVTGVAAVGAVVAAYRWQPRVERGAGMRNPASPIDEIRALDERIGLATEYAEFLEQSCDASATEAWKEVDGLWRARRALFDRTLDDAARTYVASKKKLVRRNPADDFEITQKDLDGIKILFRAPDTLALYGIPYKMREGQQPGDLWRANRDPHPYGHTGNRLKGWLWLGSPGWYGHMSDREQTMIDDFLRTLGDMVPGNPYEWSEIK